MLLMLMKTRMVIKFVAFTVLHGIVVIVRQKDLD